MRMPLAGLLLLGVLGGCQTPPPSAYVALSDSTASTIPVGNNSAGEACRRLNLGGGAADIYCGKWPQPSARIRPGGAAGADLAGLANGQGAAAAWRNDIDSRFACPADQSPRRTTVLGDAPAVVLECQYRNLGVTQVVMVAQVGGKLWLADTISAGFDATLRSIGALAGVRADSDARAADTDPQLAARLASSSYGADDIQSYQTLMRGAADANRRGDSAQAEFTYRKVLALQEKLLGKVAGQDNPDLATTVMSLGLQLSNQQRMAEAEASFARAALLIGGDGGDPTTPPRGSDPTARARLSQYRALHAINGGHPDQALALLDQAERGYAPLAQEALNRGAKTDLLAAGPVQNTSLEALFGLIDAKRNRAWALRQLDRLADSDAASRDAETLAARLPDTVSHWSQRETAFVYRTHGLTIAQQGMAARAINLFDAADRDFGLATYAVTRPRAEAKLSVAAELQRSGQSAAALARCREAVEILRRTEDGVDSAPMAPCLDAYAAEAAAGGGQDVLKSMFEAAQQVRSSQTNQQIQQAAQRMSADPQTAELVRHRDEAKQHCDALERERLLAADAATQAKLAQDGAACDRQVETLDSAIHAKFPSYANLVPKVVSADAVMAVLRPGEAFAQMVLSERSGWTFLLRDGQIHVGRIAGGRQRMRALVDRLRQTLEPDPTDNSVRHFDVAAAYELYQAVLGPVATDLQGATTLTVAPTGPLLSVPFEVLLTGPAKPRDYANAPWLVRRFAIAHVPEPGNFLALRKLAGTSHASSWFGFGAAVNVSLAQAGLSLPPDRCGPDAAAEFSGLARLEAFATQLTKSAEVMQASPRNQLTGPAFTAAAVMRMPLKQYRVLQFAAHGLLPAELSSCQPEPAIVTSAPAGAPNADGALLKTSQIEKLDLDAELVILANCNSGGPGGTTAGESLSGLARGFFAANARALLVSHWDLYVEPAAVLIPDMLARLRDQPGIGAAGALRDAQLAWLGSHTDERDLHPTIWGALAIFGEGGNGATMPSAAAGIARPKA